MDTQRLLFSPAEAAHALGVGRSTVYKLLNAGSLRRIKLGSRTLISYQDLKELTSKLSA